MFFENYDMKFFLIKVGVGKLSEISLVLDIKIYVVFVDKVVYYLNIEIDEKVKSCFVSSV